MPTSLSRSRRALRIIRPALAAVLAGWATGCAITLKTPANRFDSPEASGSLGSAHLDPVGVEGANEVVVTPNDTATPPDLQTRQIVSTGAYRLAGGVGLTDHFDVDLKFASQGVDFLQAKYQLFGDSQKFAHQGNFSGALSAAVGGGTESGTDSTGFSSVMSNYSVSYVAWDVAAIFGYRLADAVLFYGGPFHNRVVYNGTLDQSGSSSSAHYTMKGSLTQTGGNVGIQVGYAPVAVQAEWAFTRADNGIGGTLSDQQLGINLRLFW